MNVEELRGGPKWPTPIFLIFHIYIINMNRKK